MRNMKIQNQKFFNNVEIKISLQQNNNKNNNKNNNNNFENLILPKRTWNFIIHRQRQYITIEFS